jgi:hypothetical protein
MASLGSRQHVMTVQDSFPSTPVQIMDGCLKGLIATVPWVDPLRTSPSATVPKSHRSWLPTIKKLPHSLVDTKLITAKAAKCNDAGIPTHLWDRPCMLVLLHATPALAILRRLLIQVSSTALWAEFHPPNLASYR